MTDSKVSDLDPIPDAMEDADETNIARSGGDYKATYMNLVADAVPIDFAGILFDENAGAITIGITEVFHKIDDFDIDKPNALSTSNVANGRIIVGASRTYEVKFHADAISAGTNKVYDFNAFEIEAAEVSITGITQATPGVVTAAGHGLSNGDRVKIKDVVGMVEVNDKIFKVAGVSGATFELTDEADADLATGGFTAYSSGGKTQKATKLGAHTHQLYGNTSFESVSGGAQDDLTEGDAIELYVQNESGVEAITIEAASMYIKAVSRI